MPEFLLPDALPSGDTVLLDCRFSLADPDAGRAAYKEGHIPGALYVDLNRDLSGPVGTHGGRHPLPGTEAFAQTLASLGVGPDTAVVLYDDASYAFAARCWWMLRALGYREPSFLRGGYRAWLVAGGSPETDTPQPQAIASPAVPESWPRRCDREQLQQLQEQGARLVDAREAVRYRGEQEPIDPVAGHIPGAENRPWQSFISEDGSFLSADALRELWGDLAEADPLIVYCGSGVSACVNLLALAQLGRDDVWLYGGSWSDWCSYL